MKIVVLGATGAVGSRLVAQALDAGHEVVAYVRHPQAIQPRDFLSIIQGNLDDVQAMKIAFAGASAVVSCVGLAFNFSNLPHADLMQRVLPLITQATREAGVDRFVLLSAFGVGDTAAKASGFARLLYSTVISAIFMDKERSERTLPGSSLNWTILYAVSLHDGLPLASVTVKALNDVEKVPGLPTLPFANVATILLELAERNDLSGQRLLITTLNGYRSVDRLSTKHDVL